MSTSSRPRSRSLRRVVLAALAAMAMTAALAHPAAAAGAPTDPPRWSALGPGLDDAYVAVSPTLSGGYELFTIGGTQVKAYCIQAFVAIDKEVDYTLVTTADSGVANLARAAWIAINHDAVATPNADANIEAASAQLAIWSLTDGIALAAPSVPNATLRARAAALVAASVGQTAASGSGPFHGALSATAVRGAGGITSVTVTLVDHGGSPIAGQVVTITPQDGTPVAVTTNDQGQATAEVDAPLGATIALAWDVSVPAGTVLRADVADPTKAQMLVLAAPASQRVAGSTTVTEATPVTTTPPPTTPPTTAAPAPAPTDPPRELPFTGGTFGVDQLLLGLAAIAVGTGVVITTRRRRA